MRGILKESDCLRLRKSPKETEAPCCGAKSARDCYRGSDCEIHCSLCCRNHVTLYVVHTSAAEKNLCKAIMQNYDCALCDVSQLASNEHLLSTHREAVSEHSS